jgi:hypothetical protein
LEDEVSKWILKVVNWGYEAYLRAAAAIALLYLVIFVPIATVLEVTNTLKLSQFDNQRLDRGWTGAIIVTIFLLVLKTSRDVDEIKEKLDAAEN